MSIRHLLARPWLALHRVATAVRGGGAGVRLLLLHDVPPDEMAALDRLVGWLAASGRLATPEEVEESLTGGAVADGKVALTFDDGFASNLEAAHTVLARHGARAIFFICPGLMALEGAEQRAAVAANVFNGRRAVDERMRLMTWGEVAALAAMGHVIANHTLSHRRLSRLDDAGIEAEIAGGACAIAAQLGRAPDWFAFPFGDMASVTPAVLAAAARHHRFCRSGVRGANTGSIHPMAVLADHVDLAAPFAYQRLAVEGGLDPRHRDARAGLAAMAPEIRARALDEK